ncbi:sensor histidine kinase [Paenibacillus thalictri]|uniref:histidine kinase n=1 Tax=Paenibacillus thalictri TaxID=2527873 RepID=A0A4Q9DTW4_9BACL|nr:HAMP domain-containing sensor histidine kinase [Paenibacillus thalictri]TBL80386.1 HAMP domain-containing histidine kinase [Paenibacillus thalictri]
MSLKFRLIMLTSIWLILIVAFFNIFIYFFFVRMSMLSESRVLWNKAQIILRNPDVHLPDYWSNKKLLNEFSEPNTLIRLIGSDRIVHNQIATNDDLVQHPAVYRTSYHWESERSSAGRLLYVQVPIYDDDKQVGQLEIGRALNVLNDYITVLATALTLTSVGILLFSVVGGLIYSRFIFRPIHELANTMQEIQHKGAFAKLNPDLTRKNDELGRLGYTFNEMIDRLQENDKLQKQFVADASHELRTPLTVIESYVSLLGRWGWSDAAIRKEALEAISSETARLKSLTGSLLQLAQAHKEDKPEKQPTRLTPLLTSISRHLSVTFRRHIELSEPSEDVVLRIDPEQIRQLVIILLDNAIKYSSDDIALEWYRAQHSVVIRVIDKGIGIAEDELPHIFERFYRVDKARSRQTGGSGLGLSIAKRIAELHGGTIQAESVKGQGTQLTVTLPTEIELM